ncbi:MAG: PHP domain-containing protein, partial [Ruminococcaceae bacterium]|nr:PHP domain-containing protein [Oscillospiraceae bacterium]
MKSKITTEVHTHTIASSHAYSTIHEMITECARKGIELLAITDHGPALNNDGAHYWHFYNLKSIPRRVNGVYVIRGAE